MNLLIPGASGGCGRWLVRLAVERGHHVRAIVRPGTPFDAPSDAEVNFGDVLDPGVIDETAAECHAVLSALGIKRKSPRNPWSALVSPSDLISRATGHLVAAAERHNVRRVIAISAAGVGDSITSVHPVIRWMIRRSNMSVAYTDLGKMERILAESGVDWMAVRPTTLTDDLPSGAVQITDHYGLRGRISRGDVAAFMLDALDREAPFSLRTPMISGGRSVPKAPETGE